MSYAARRLLIPLSVMFAIAVPALQAGLDLGLSAKAFAGQGDSTLRAAGYAFSIWSVIYAGLIAYAVWQALPRNADDPLLARIAWPSMVAISGCGLWIIASSANWQWASVAIIVASAATLTVGLVRLAPERGRLLERAVVWWPLSLLAGWLTIASAINVLTVLTAQGLLSGGSAEIAGYVGVAVVLGVGLLVLSAARLPVYAVPIVWGLVGVWVAEKAAKPDLAAEALISAGVVGVYAAWRAWRRDAPLMQGHRPGAGPSPG